MKNNKSEIEKGCGKEFLWIKYLNDKRICGQIEDLKHSEHIILCPECKAKLKTFQSGLLKAKDDFRKIIDEVIDKRIEANQKMLTPNISIVEIKNGQGRNLKEELKQKIGDVKK